jgi:hypothetical protein
MKKISEQHVLDLEQLADLYDTDVLISELKRIGSAKLKRIGSVKLKRRPADLVLNIGIIWAHIEFLIVHRATKKKKRLEEACALLEGYINRFTVGAMGKKAKTLENIYKRARKEARTEPMIAAVMNDAYRVLSRHLEHAPQKIPIPYLIEGAADGWKFPTIDPNQFGDDCDAIGSKGPSYGAVFSLIVTPKNI